ncbi:unnamed protein product, partial [Phaeothamnion confervicola]
SLAPALAESRRFRRALDTVHWAVSQAFRRGAAYATSFDVLAARFVDDAKFLRDARLEQLAGAEVQDLRDDLARHAAHAREHQRIRRSAGLGLLRVDTVRLEAALRPSPARCMALLERLVPALYHERQEALLSELMAAHAALSRRPRSVEDFVGLMRGLREQRARSGETEARYRWLVELYGCMEQSGVPIPEDVRTGARMTAKVRRLLEAVDGGGIGIDDDRSGGGGSSTFTGGGSGDGNFGGGSSGNFSGGAAYEVDGDAASRREEDHRRFVAELEGMVTSLRPLVREAMEDLAHGMLENPAADARDAVAYLERCGESVRAILAKADRYGEWQATLEVAALDRSELDLMEAELSNKLRLWRGIDGFSARRSAWEQTPFAALDLTALEGELAAFWGAATLSEQRLPANPVTAHFRAMVDRFRTAVPVLADLRSAHLGPRHWDAIERHVGLGPDATRTATLGELLARDLGAAADAVAGVTTQAEQEAGLARVLEKVAAAWLEARFEVGPTSSSAFSSVFSGSAASASASRIHNGGGERRGDAHRVPILGGIEQTAGKLEDSLVAVQGVLASPYAGETRVAAEALLRRLLLLQRTVDEWARCQRAWLRLEAVFAAPDVHKQLAEEALAFRSVDGAWRDLMQRTADRPGCLEAGTAPGLLDSLKAHNAELERVERGLDAFLETKRRAFPRLYFLSDDDLLELLAGARDPRTVQPHLRKLFDALHELDFYGAGSGGGGGNDAAGTATVAATSAGATAIAAAKTPTD